MKISVRKMNSILLSVILVCALLPARADASFEIPGTCRVQTDTGAAYTVKTLDYGYGHNTYLSLRDVAVALMDTEKAFSLEITKSTVSMNLGNAYTPVGAENVPWEDSENPNISLRRNECKVNGQEVYYYTLITKLPSGYYDCFMMAADLAMILDVDITVPEAGSIQFHTQAPFRVSPQELEQAAHSYELPKPVRTVVTVCGAMRGVGGIDSFGADVEKAYHVSAEEDSAFSFRVRLI